MADRASGTGSVTAADQVVKFVDDVINTIGDFKAKIWPLLNSPRSVVCLVANATDTPLTYIDSHHDHGGFAATPEPVIDARKGSSFGSQSKAGSLFTGCQGQVRYRGDDEVFFTVNWDNPYVGDNSSSAGIDGNSGHYLCWSVTGVGNEKAEMRFVLLKMAHEMHGAIRDKWTQAGGLGSGLGVPQTDETPAPGGGAFNDFEDGGSIYWSPATGAHIVHGAIRLKYLAMGGPGSGLEYPTSDEAGAADSGFFNDFQDGGSIYWSPDTGAHYVHGAIREKWLSLGGAKSYIGFPTPDETLLPDGVGFFNDFQDGGSIYWSPTAGAHVLHGAIRLKYLSLGGPQGSLGYPTSDESSQGDGFSQRFERGTITWTPSGGAIVG